MGKNIDSIDLAWEEISQSLKGDHGIETYKQLAEMIADKGIFGLTKLPRVGISRANMIIKVVMRQMLNDKE